MKMCGVVTLFMIFPYASALAISPAVPEQAQTFLQIRRNIDDDNAQAAEMARLEDQADKMMGEDGDETSKNSDSQDNEDGPESFLQTGRNIDDDNAQAAEMARLEDQADKMMGEDDAEISKSSDSEDNEDGPESFLQTGRNIDDDNAQAAEMARLEDQADKMMEEDDDETSRSSDSEDGEDEQESFLQTGRNIDDDNAQAAEMARLEDQADKMMGEDDDETSKSSDSQDNVDEPESFLQTGRNIDDDNAQAAEMARLEDQADKMMGEDDDETSKSSDNEENEDEPDSFLQTGRNIDDDNAQAAEMARLEDQADKMMGEDDDETSKSSDNEENEDGPESFLQTGRNIDDDNAQAAEMARLEDQADKIMNGDDDEKTSKSSDSKAGSEDEAGSFIQMKHKFMKKYHKIDEGNAQAAEMARLEDEVDKQLGEDTDEIANDDHQAEVQSEESE